MKIFFRLLYTALLLTVLSAIWTACKYDVAEPLWDQPYADKPIPSITGIEPVGEAPGGINYITINGENFLNVPDTNGVYFNTTTAEVVSKSSTSVTVRRPDIISDSCIVKVVPGGTEVTAKYSPYKVDEVSRVYGIAINTTLYATAVDANENVYVIDGSSPRNVIKINPSGQMDTVGTSPNSPSDAVFGPDGRLYLPRDNREILVLDVNTGGEADRWTRMPSGKVVDHGIFDNNGYFYTAGNHSDLIIVAPDPPVSNPPLTYSGYYDNDKILCMTIYQSYIYLAVQIANPDAEHPELAIWRHSIDGVGNVGNMELVQDLSADEIFTSRDITAIHFDANGNLFIITDSADPILIEQVGSNTVDYFYKNILPSNGKHFSWGTGNYAYMIVEDSDFDTTNPWNLVRVDMGSASAAQ